MMSNSEPARRFRIEYDPRLVEEAVLLRIAGDPAENQFRRALDWIYELPEGAERERPFQEHHAEWFGRLQLGKTVKECCEELPVLLQQVRRCCVLPARTTQEEGADLHGLRHRSPADPLPDKVAVIRLKPSRLLDALGARDWLRRELMHLTDMLDPAFGYEPQLPSHEAGPAFANLLRERYRTLWDTWIDGRLFRRGWLPEGAREKRREEFWSVFSVGGADAESKFQEIFDSDSETHAGFVAFALNPSIPTDPVHALPSRPKPCPLCRFPTYQLQDERSALSEEVREWVRRDFPRWLPEEGLCLQCADLYRARELSRSAAAALPRF